MIAQEIEKTVAVKKGSYEPRRGVRLIAQTSEDRKLLDAIMNVGVEVDSVEGGQLDLRLCK